MKTLTELKKMKKDDLIEYILKSQSDHNPVPVTDEAKVTMISPMSWDGTQALTIIKIGSKKFKIRYDNSNGFPLGFNYKFSASVMNDEGSWDYVAERSDINYENVSYVADKREREQDAKHFIRAMTKYLVKIYS